MPENDPRITLDAPAKINLFLHVSGRRDDGYHLLDSLVSFTEYGDRLVAEPGDDLTLRINGPFASGLDDGDTDNLILRAARLLRDASRTRAGAMLTLTKNLPVSSGLGGGSADAAAALRILARLWRLDVDDARLSEIGLSVGADVPVCIAGVPCRMTGIGETVTPVNPFPPCAVVLVNGGEAVATPSVFAAREDVFSDGAAWSGPVGFDTFVAALRDCANDLSAAACTLSPMIDDVLAELTRSDGCALARLSGSGGTCFGLFADSATAEAAAAAIRARHLDWWCKATRFREHRVEIQTG